MTILSLNDVFNDIIALNDETFSAFLQETDSIFHKLEKEQDVDNLKVLRNRLSQLADNLHKKLSRKERGTLADLVDTIDDTVSAAEREQKESLQMVDIIKKYRKKNQALTELPEEKKDSHILVAKKKKEIKYEEHMLQLQLEIVKLQKHIQETGQKLLIIFEGRDAAGKGGNIKRFTENLNPRYAKVVALAKPTDAERTQWYFQRYISHLPNGGEMIFFDRSWYNRAGVEPVMGFVKKKEYEQFLDDVPRFERMLVDSGIKIIKFYFSVSKDEQAARFDERKTNPLKQFKLSPIDQFSQKLWDRYTVAEYENFAHTHSEHAPWIVIDTDNKLEARLNAMRYVLSQYDYPEKTDGEHMEIDTDVIMTGEKKLKHLKDEIDEDIELF